MTVAARPTSPQGRRSACAVVLMALILFGYSHSAALTLGGFADDLGLLTELPNRANAGTLLADVLAKFVGALWPGATMWRPLPYASFAVDAALWGNQPGLWHITNLALHISVATFASLLVARLTGVALAGAGAFATLLLAPWSPEVTLWLVGRFDGWASLGIVISLWAAVRSRGVDRWAAVSAIAAVAAYASKESALLLPLYVTLVRMWRGVSGSQEGLDPARKLKANRYFQTPQRWMPILLTHAVLLLTYLAWRAHLFAGQAVSVYASQPEYRWLPLLARIGEHAAFANGLAPLARGAAIVTAALAAVFLLLALLGRYRMVAAVGVLMVFSLLAAVAANFPRPPGEGEGYRLYYLATVGAALIAGAGIAQAQQYVGVASRAICAALLLALFVAMGVWQSSVAEQWVRASRTIAAASRAMTTAATQLAPNEFGLVLMPDLMGHVPVARNAQGALTTLQDGSAPARAFFIVFTPPQLAEWHQLAKENVVQKLTQRAHAPERITRYFCVDTRFNSLEDLGYWTPGTLPEWTARWRNEIAARCPELIP